MPRTAEDLASDDLFLSAILRCANELIAMYCESPRIASIFAAQQRWLLAHAGFALFHGLPGGSEAALYSARFVDFTREHKIASRNTAVAFIQEMLAYRFLRPIPELSDRRTRLLEPTEIANMNFVRWLRTHLAILDHLDQGERVAKLDRHTQAFTKIQPLIAMELFNREDVRDPGPIFRVFNTANSGGVIMDYLMSHIDPTALDGDVFFIGRISMKDIRERFMISNTHLKRLLKQAAALGGVGWADAPGRSDFWVSRRFVSEYQGYQAGKFAIIDAATAAVLGEERAARTPRAAAAT